MAIPDLVAAERKRVERLRKEEAENRCPIRARVGELAVARCWPYLDMYRVCHVTRVDEEGYATHLKDGAGVRYAANAREKKGATIMPETVFIVARERLAVAAREIAARYWESHFVGTAQSTMDRAVRDAGCLKEGATTDPARYPAEPQEVA